MTALCPNLASQQSWRPGEYRNRPENRCNVGLDGPDSSTHRKALSPWLFANHRKTYLAAQAQNGRTGQDSTHANDRKSHRDRGAAVAANALRRCHPGPGSRSHGVSDALRLDEVRYRNPLRPIRALLCRSVGAPVSACMSGGILRVSVQ